MVQTVRVQSKYAYGLEHIYIYIYTSRHIFKLHLHQKIDNLLVQVNYQRRSDSQSLKIQIRKLCPNDDNVNIVNIPETYIDIRDVFITICISSFM